MKARGFAVLRAGRLHDVKEPKDFGRESSSSGSGSSGAPLGFPFLLAEGRDAGGEPRAIMLIRLRISGRRESCASHAVACHCAGPPLSVKDESERYRAEQTPVIVPARRLPGPRGAGGTFSSRFAGTAPAPSRSPS